MLLLLLKSTACLLAFLVFYKLLLEHTSHHHFKRFYLIGSVLVSIGIPLITIIEYVEPQFVLDSFKNPIDESIPSSSAERLNPNSDYLSNILWSIYGLGVLIYSIKFINNLIQITLKIRKNPKQKNTNYISVLLQDLIVPHTFFNYVFFNKTQFENKKIPNEVLLHESTHAKEMHSIDILFIEVLQIMFWFNPLIYLIKKDIKLNHEFIADQAVIHQGIQPSIYQHLILEFTSNSKTNPLANAINYSSIKKRFTIMKIQTSKKNMWLKSFLILPLLAVLSYGFSSKNIIVNTQDLEQTITQEIPEGEGVTEAMLKEYNDFTNQYKQTRRIANYSHLRIIAIYKMMTKEQRHSVSEPHFQWFNHNKIYTIPRHPTQTEFDSWKKSKDLVFSIDDKVIRTDELNNYSPQDIYSYSNNFFSPEKGSYKSAHYILKTKKGFQQQNQDIRVRAYNTLFLKYSNEIKHYLNSGKQNNSELKILKSQLDDLYKVLTPEDLKKFNLLKAPELADESYNETKRENKIKENLKKYLLEKRKELDYSIKQTKTLKEKNEIKKLNQFLQERLNLIEKDLENDTLKIRKWRQTANIIEYNQLAKKYNDQNLKKPATFHLKSKELKQLYNLYENLTTEEKENAEPFPYFSNRILKRHNLD